MPWLYRDDNAGVNLRRRRHADANANSNADCTPGGGRRAMDRRQPIPATTMCAMALPRLPRTSMCSVESLTALV